MLSLIAGDGAFAFTVQFLFGVTTSCTLKVTLLFGIDDSRGNYSCCDLTDALKSSLSVTNAGFSFFKKQSQASPFFLAPLCSYFTSYESLESDNCAQNFFISASAFSLTSLALFSASSSWLSFYNRSRASVFTLKLLFPSDFLIDAEISKSSSLFKLYS